LWLCSGSIATSIAIWTPPWFSCWRGPQSDPLSGVAPTENGPTLIGNLLSFCLAREPGVISVEIVAKIRRWHFREHVTIREIARCTSLSKNTVKAT
jgi:hypothetical protein